MISLPIPGGAEAPRMARKEVLSWLGGQVPEARALDVALVVSELVTNSVLHAHLNADDTVLVEIAVGDSHLAITVTDPGRGLLPRLGPRDPLSPHGFGLNLVNDISSSWGARGHPGARQVWCELALDESGRGSEPERSGFPT